MGTPDIEGGVLLGSPDRGGTLKETPDIAGHTDGDTGYSGAL